MNIKTKLLLSFSVIIVLTIILGLISYKSLGTLTNGLIPVIEANNNITSSMLQLRRNEKDFLARAVLDPDYYELGKNEYLTKFDDSFKILNDNIAIAKSFSTDVKYLNRIQRIQALSNKYRVGFINIATKKKERGFKDWGKVGQLRSAVRKIEDELSGINSTSKDKLLVAMLTLQRHEKDYLLRGDIKYQRSLTEEVKRFINLVKASDLSFNMKSILESEAKNYEIRFNDVVYIDEVIGRTTSLGLMGDYREIIHQLELVVDKQIKFLKGEVSSVSRNSTLVIGIALLLIVLIGLGLALFLASKITGPIKEMSEAGKKVANGDLSATIPTVTTNDEIKEMSETMDALIGALKFHLKKG